MRYTGRLSALLIILLVIPAFTGCGQPAPEPLTVEGNYGVYYEIFVKSYYDSDGDGNGDLNGVTQQLDYLEDLGITGIWLTPVFASPSYHKYDVTDYYSIDPEFGTEEDLRQLAAEAEARGIKVIIDLVVNHTSTQHPWFVEASADPAGEFRDYYVWASEDTNLYQRGESKQQVWHESETGYYYANFWGGMPDLNLDNLDVRREIIEIAEYWLDTGIAGFRLDAVKHIYTDHEQNLEWWRYFRAQLADKYPDVYLVGEVWDTANVAAPYYESLDSLFNFNLAEKIIAAVKDGRHQDVAKTLERNYAAFSPYSSTFIDAVFLTNHDQTRVMNSLGQDIEKSKLAASILLTLPGNPFIYYGEELGMRGKKPDENIREPMQWFSNPGTPGQTSWQPLRDNADGVTPPAEEQQNDPDSLLSHYRSMIAARKSLHALVYGGIQAYETGDRGVMAYIRTHDNGDALVVHNLKEEPVEVALAGWGKLFYRTDGAARYRNGALTLPAGSTGILTKGK